ncbi:hypothetical protein ACGYWA_32585 [Burkholderia pseudomallei]
MHIIAKTPISSNHRNEIFEFIQKSRYLEGNFICCGDDINLKITPIHTEANLSRKYVSEHVLLIAPQPEGEQLRFRKKLQDAFENIKKNVDRIENSCNVIIMRVHPTADIAWLQTQAMQFINDHIDSACDAVILIQPSVVRSAVGSQIHYTVQIASNLKFAQSGGGIQAPYRYQFGIGSVSMEPTKLMLMGSDGPLSEIGQRMYFTRKESTSRFLIQMAMEGSLETSPIQEMGLSNTLYFKLMKENLHSLEYFHPLTICISSNTYRKID